MPVNRVEKPKPALEDFDLAAQATPRRRVPRPQPVFKTSPTVSPVMMPTQPRLDSIPAVPAPPAEFAAAAPAATPVPAPEPKPAAPAPALSEFKITQASDQTALNPNGDTYEEEELPPPGQAKIAAMEVAFLVRTFLPWIAVAAFLVVGFLFRGPITDQVSSWHKQLLAKMRPKVIDDGPISSIDTDVAKSPELAKAALERVLRANVTVAVEGMGTGAGTVCSIVGSEALILTNRSVVDQMFSLTNGAESSHSLPKVDLEYSDQTRASGEVIWVADDGIDLAIIKATTVGLETRSADWQGLREIGKGDTVFFVDGIGGEPEQQLHKTDVSDVGNADLSDRQIPIVQVQRQNMPAGTGLFNETGQLIAIASQGSDDPSTAIVVSLLDELKPAALLTPTDR